MLPSGTVVAHKTGTGGTVYGVIWATNDVGVITLPGGRSHLAVAVFVRDSHLDASRTDGLIARLSRAAFNEAL